MPWHAPAPGAGLAGANSDSGREAAALVGPNSVRPGPALLRMGLTFSVGLTLFPIGLASIDWLIRVVRLWIW